MLNRYKESVLAYNWVTEVLAENDPLDLLHLLSLQKEHEY